MLLFVKSNLFLILFSFVESLFRIIQFGPFVMTEITKSFASKYQNDHPKWLFPDMSKVGCVVPTIAVAKLLHAEFRPSGTHSTLVRVSTRPRCPGCPRSQGQWSRDYR